MYSLASSKLRNNLSSILYNIGTLNCSFKTSFKEFLVVQILHNCTLHRHVYLECDRFCLWWRHLLVPSAKLESKGTKVWLSETLVIVFDCHWTTFSRNQNKRDLLLIWLYTVCTVLNEKMLFMVYIHFLDSGNCFFKVCSDKVQKRS